MKINLLKGSNDYKILPNHYNWKGGGENTKQEYECLKTTFYPGFIVLYILFILEGIFKMVVKMVVKIFS